MVSSEKRTLLTLGSKHKSHAITLPKNWCNINAANELEIYYNSVITIFPPDIDPQLKEKFITFLKNPSRFIILPLNLDSQIKEKLINILKNLAEVIDDFVKKGKYSSKISFIEDAIREKLAYELSSTRRKFPNITEGDLNNKKRTDLLQSNNSLPNPESIMNQAKILYCKRCGYTFNKENENISFICPGCKKPVKLITKEDIEEDS